MNNFEGNNFSEQKLKAIVDSLRKLVRCPSCNGIFSKADFQMIAGFGKSYVIRISCSSCNANLFPASFKIDLRFLIDDLDKSL